MLDGLRYLKRFSTKGVTQKKGVNGVNTTLGSNLFSESGWKQPELAFRDLGPTRPELVFFA